MSARRDPRRGARRRVDVEAFDSGALPPDVIPDGSALWCSLAGTDRRTPGRTSTVVVGLYDVDTIRCYLRPRCGCGWTTESVTTWEAEDRGQVAQRAMLAHVDRDHGDPEPTWRFTPGHWSFYGGVGERSRAAVVVRSVLEHDGHTLEHGPAASADGA